MDAQSLWTVFFAGGFGGLLHTIYYNGYRLPLPRIRRNEGVEVHVGFLGDILLGIGAALAVTFLAGNLQFARLVPLSLLAGFGGGALLGSLESKMRESMFREKINEIDGKYGELVRKLERIEAEEGDEDGEE